MINKLKLILTNLKCREIDMAATPEKKVKDAVTKILKEYNAYYFYPATGGFGRSGVPDIVACFNGYFIGIECKAGNNTTTALQDRELAKIEFSGGIPMVVNETNIKDVREVLDALSD
jgi:Holliday junction resolvase